MCLTHLRLNVEHTSATCARNLANGHEAGTVAIAGKLCVLDEGILCEKVFELIVGDEVVVFCVLLTGARCAGGV